MTDPASPLPSTGPARPFSLTRWGRYLVRRLQRMPGTPYSIAAGFACGVAVSFTPYLTLHTPLALGSAWLMRGNMLASFVGTWVGNLATTPLFWWLSFSVGRPLVSLWFPEIGGDVEKAIDAMMSFHVSEILTGRFLLAFFLPMAIGSCVTAPLGWAAAFYPTRWALTAWRRRRAEHRERKRVEIRAMLDQWRSFQRSSDAIP